MTVKLTVRCGARDSSGDRWGCGAILGTFYDSINEKWPFWCEHCGSNGFGDKYPWEIKAEVIPSETDADDWYHQETYRTAMELLDPESDQPEYERDWYVD